MERMTLCCILKGESAFEGLESLGVLCVTHVAFLGLMWKKELQSTRHLNGRINLNIRMKVYSDTAKTILDAYNKLLPPVGFHIYAA